MISEKEIEKELDKEFKKMGVKPRIYHFRDVNRFECVTVVTEDTKYNRDDIASFIWKYTDRSGFNPATHLIERLIEHKDMYGIAICNEHDIFNRQEGRERAKRRLMRHLKNGHLSYQQHKNKSRKEERKNESK